jgi:hypothetical protein
VGDGVTRGPGDLRRAAQRVGVLDAGVLGAAVAGDDLRAGEQRPQVGGRDRLAGLGTQRLQVGGEHGIGAEQSLDAERGSEVGEHEQFAQVGDREQQHPEHPVGAVDEREALLLGERHGGEPGGVQCLPGVVSPAVAVGDGALPHERQGTVGERREVPRTAE